MSMELSMQSWCAAVDGLGCRSSRVPCRATALRLRLRASSATWIHSQICHGNMYCSSASCNLIRTCRLNLAMLLGRTNLKESIVVRGPQLIPSFVIKGSIFQKPASPQPSTPKPQPPSNPGEGAVRDLNLNPKNPKPPSPEPCP